MAATILQRGLALVLLPLFLSLLTVQQYGLIVAWTTVTSLLALLLTCGLSPMAMRELVLAEGGQQAGATTSAAAWLSLALPLLGLLGSCPLLALPLPLGVKHAALVLAAASLFAGAEILGVPKLRARARVAPTAMYLFVLVVPATAVRVLLVAVLEGGVTAWLVSDVVTAVFVWTFATWTGRAEVRAVRPWHQLPAVMRQIALAWTFALHQAALWCTALGDRLVVTAVLGPNQLGVYALAAQFSVIARQLLGDANRSLMNYYVTEVQRDIRLVARRQLYLGSTLVILFAGASQLYLLRLVPSSYSDAADLSLVLMAAVIPVSLYLVNMNVLTMTAAKFTTVWRISLPAGATTVALGAVGGVLAGAAGVATASVFTTSVLAAVAAAQARKSITTLPRVASWQWCFVSFLAMLAIIAVTELTGLTERLLALALLAVALLSAGGDLHVGMAALQRRVGGVRRAQTK